MAEGPDPAGKVKPEPPPPPSDAARILDGLDRTRKTIVRSVAIATLLILSALVYMRCSDPWWRCKRLDEEASGISGSEIEVWDDLECNEWPGI